MKIISLMESTGNFFFEFQFPEKGTEESSGLSQLLSLVHVQILCLTSKYDNLGEQNLQSYESWFVKSYAQQKLFAFFIHCYLATS